MASATRAGPRRLISTAWVKGASKETVAAEWITTSLAASAARPSSSRPRPSCPTSPATAWTRRATSGAKLVAELGPEAVEAVVADDFPGQSGRRHPPSGPGGPVRYVGLGDAAQDAFDQRSAQKSGGSGNEEALCPEVPADRHRELFTIRRRICLPFGK